MAGQGARAAAHASPAATLDRPAQVQYVADHNRRRHEEVRHHDDHRRDRHAVHVY